MKRGNSIIGLLLVILLAGSGCHNIRHDRKAMKDSGRIMRMGQNFRPNRGNSHNSDSLMMRGMRRGMGPGWMGTGRDFAGHAPMMGMQGNIGRGMMPGGMGQRMMRGMGRMPMDSIGWMPMGPGRRMMESIPNVTENQKKQIADLIKKQGNDMKKLREEMSSKMQSMRESNRKDMLGILTEEQRKFIKDSESSFSR